MHKCNAMSLDLHFVLGLNLKKHIIHVFTKVWNQFEKKSITALLL